MDIPVSPGSRATTAYAWMRSGKTREMRQRYREALLNLTRAEIQKIVQTELSPQSDSGVIVSFAGKELLQKETLLLAQMQKDLPILPI
jgi:hypothetical protein